jgi:membrane associated rhomboid family serine protease
MLAEMRQAEPWVVVASVASESRAAELGLVLTARGIEHRRQPVVGAWEVCVPAGSAELAAAELRQYLSENTRAIGHRRVEEVGDGWPGVLAYVAVLLLVFVCVRESALSLDWYGAGRFQAGRVVAGEWWRSVTALTLHVEIDHLLGNLAFGAFFGYFAGRHLGVGAGWLAIVCAAALANGVDALLQPPAHRSIGASTAVFAALGILTAYTWRRGFLRETPWRGRIAPIVAGLGLLAFTGTGGENTDLLAHFTGFVVGFGSGLALARYARVERLSSSRLQRVCAAIAVVLVVGAWIWGLAAAG